MAQSTLPDSHGALSRAFDYGLGGLGVLGGFLAIHWSEILQDVTLVAGAATSVLGVVLLLYRLSVVKLEKKRLLEELVGKDD